MLSLKESLLSNIDTKSKDNTLASEEIYHNGIQAAKQWFKKHADMEEHIFSEYYENEAIVIKRVNNIPHISYIRPRLNEWFEISNYNADEPIPTEFVIDKIQTKYGLAIVDNDFTKLGMMPAATNKVYIRECQKLTTLDNFPKIIQPAKAEIHIERCSSLTSESFKAISNLSIKKFEIDCYVDSAKYFPQAKEYDLIQSRGIKDFSELKVTPDTILSVSSQVYGFDTLKNLKTKIKILNIELSINFGDFKEISNVYKKRFADVAKQVNVM